MIVDQMDFTVSAETWATLPVDQTQKDHWKKRLEEGTAAKNRKTELEGFRVRLTGLQEQNVAELSALERDLPDIVLSWAEGKHTHAVLAKHKMKISEKKTLLEDIKAGLSAIETAIAHETNTDINHAMGAMNQIRYLMEKEAAKKAKEAKG
jgi:hypothetical protein